MVVSTVASQQRVPASTPSWGLSVWSLHVLPVYAWVLSGFLPPSKNMHVRLIGVSKILLRSEFERVCGCLSLCGPVMDWRPIQGVPRLLPDDRWDRLQPPRDPTYGLSGYRKWMDVLKLKQTKFQQFQKCELLPSPECDITVMVASLWTRMLTQRIMYEGNTLKVNKEMKQRFEAVILMCISCLCLDSHWKLHITVLLNLYVHIYC